MLEHLRVPRGRAGARIRVISPALPQLAYAPHRGRRAERALTELGFTVSYGSRASLISEDGTTAGTGRERAADFMEAFQDPEVDAVFASEAGLGSRDLLDFLDAAVIAGSPKPFIGYCDNVYLHLFLAASAGVGSLYGCSFMHHFGEPGGPFPETVDYFMKALIGSDPLVCTPMRDRVGKHRNWFIPEIDSLPRDRTVEGGSVWRLRAGTARGTLVGGELTLIPELVRRFSLSLRSVVLFWDVSYHGFSAPAL